MKWQMRNGGLNTRTGDSKPFNLELAHSGAEAPSTRKSPAGDNKGAAPPPGPCFRFAAAPGFITIKYHQVQS